MVDIILPTWNAFEYVKDCVDSIQKNTDPSEYRIILVDDCSPDKRISEYFNKVKREQDVYILNEENLGFVKTSNKGLKFGRDNDVVLLNTDTIVTKNWLVNLKSAAYSNPTFGLVNPISNNASIFSVREICEVGLKPEEVAEILSKTAKGINLEIPVGVGYCLYIKREVLNKIGYLDEIFGRGYGEENDLCLRAMENGYKTIITDKAFVYHKGSVSFILAGDIKKTDQNQISSNEKHEQIVIKRYPNFVGQINDSDFRLNLENFKKLIVYNFFELFSGNRKSILYILHGNPEKNIGGTEIHTLDLSNRLSKDFQVYISFVEGRSIFVNKYINGTKIISYRFVLPINLIRFDLLSNSAKLGYQMLVNFVRPDIVHVQHFKNNTLDIVDVAKHKGIPVVYTMHDYYTVSPNHNLSFKVERETYLEDKKSTQEELNLYTGRNDVTEENWQFIFNKYLTKFDSILAPSQTVNSEVTKIYPELLGKIEVNEIPLFIAHAEEEIPNSPSSKKRICFLGGVASEIKGQKIIEEICPELLEKGYEIHFLGTSEGILNLPISKNLIFHGPYKREDVLNLLHKISPRFTIVLSIVKESFSYTISESFMAGIPVLTTPIGAQKERVVDSGFGEVFKSFNSKDIVEEIEKYCNSDKKYSVKNLIDNDGYIQYLLGKYNKLIESAEINYDEMERNFINNLFTEQHLENDTLNSRQKIIVRLYNKIDSKIFANQGFVSFLKKYKVKARLKKAYKNYFNF